VTIHSAGNLAAIHWYGSFFFSYSYSCTHSIAHCFTYVCRNSDPVVPADLGVAQFQPKF
jgi:hypothetical protein